MPECVNLEEKEGRLHFCLFRHRLAGTHIVLDSHRLYGTASHTIEEHCQEFIRQFVRHHGVCNVTEAFCYDFAIEELEDWENRDSDASRKKSGRTSGWRIPTSQENGRKRSNGCQENRSATL